MTGKRAVIAGTGSCLPEKTLTNAELEKMVDTTDEWIVQRSGIKERRIAGESETTSSMAIKAAEKALVAAGCRPDEIDGIIVATTTPDQTFPSVAVRVQAELGVPAGMAFDVQAVCTGFVYALSTADAFIRGGNARRVLVIGAEKMSSIIDWADRTTCVLFADGAGAVVLESSDEREGILSTHLYANGHQRDLLYTEKGAHLTMAGRDVFKYAVHYLAEIVNEVCEANHITGRDLDWLVPHQANIRIIEATAKKLDLPMDRVVVTIDRHGNTSAASIPLALDEPVRDGRIKRDQLILLEAMGGGLTWGAALLRY